MAEIEPTVVAFTSSVLASQRVSLLRTSEFTNVAAGLETTVVSRASLGASPLTENLLSGYSCLVMKDLFILALFKGAEPVHE